MAYLMVDQAFAVAVKTYEERPEMTPSAKVAYYFGAMMLICPLWYLFTFVGAVVGQAIPASYSLDFAVPICFIALTAPLPHVIAALVSCVAAIAFAWVPWSLGLIFAALTAMITGAQAELFLRRRAERKQEGTS
jgi:predicted branched-subunit amino acid permease